MTEVLKPQSGLDSREDVSDSELEPPMDVNTVIDELSAEGEQLNPFLLDKLEEVDLLEALKNRVGADMKEYLRHSNRFANLVKTRRVPLGPTVEIPVSDANVDAAGERRRYEEGPLVDLELLEQKEGVDPKHVLYFRVTQPSVAGPKPEYYWTSDVYETKNGLGKELGEDMDTTAVVLVSTLADISQNGGLILDTRNDDAGLPVRQIAHGVFDQSKCIMILPR